MAELYLSLNSRDEEKALKYLEELELLECVENRGDSQEVLAEIVLDCRKKVASLIRSRCGTFVQQLLSKCRKQLYSKVSVGSDSSHTHSQRHLNTLVELLGEWSNIVLELSQLNTSAETLTILIDPLHARISELSIECFHQFNTDKNLTSWQSRIRRCVGEDQSLNIGALDQIIGQLAGMRAVIAQYQTFLSLRCAFEDLSNHEMGEWREADGTYIALEYGYMLGAMREATKVSGILELQEGKIFALQSVEDSFFVLQRSLERAISTAQQGNIYAICAKVVQLIDPLELEDLDRNIYHILSSKDSFRIKRLDPQDASPDDSSAPDLSIGQTKTPVASAPAHSSPAEQTEPLDVADGVKSAVNAVREGNLVSGVSVLSSAFADMAGGFLEVVAPMNALNEREEEEASLSTPIAAVASNASNTIEQLIGTISDDLDNADGNHDDTLRTVLDMATGIPPPKASDVSYPRSILSVEDASLQLNSLAIPINALEIITSSIGEDNLGSISTLDVAREEIDRVKSIYLVLLEKETKAIVAAEFYGGLYAQYSGTGASPGTGVYIRIVIENLSNYEITGEEMDRRSNHSDLVSAVAMCVSGGGDRKTESETGAESVERHGSWVATHFAPRLTSRAYSEILKQLAEIFSKAIVEHIKNSRFNEWGAMLMQHEINECVSIMEARAAHVDESVRSSVAPAMWAATIIALDHPSDIRRYKVPMEVFNEDTVRMIMRQRVEFPSEAIKGVKLCF